ncbi:MAG: hypothetical protein ICV64_07125 [Thermoleophilia bacterium]|nr:hypothetical protein [Thermoleophilia bacterium]
MRPLVLVCLAAVLALPATAAAVHVAAAGDGTLSVSNAEGRVEFLRSFSGVVLGRVTTGRLEVVNPDADCNDLGVWDVDEVRELPLRGSRDGVRCVFRTVDRSMAMRFRLVREGDEVLVAGAGIWISAVGQGRVYLEGKPNKLRDGTFSINGERRGSLPDAGRTFTIGSRRPAAAP